MVVCARQTNRVAASVVLRWSAWVGVLASGCLGEFMSEAQVAARIEAFQLSVDVAAVGDESVDPGTTETPVADVGSQDVSSAGEVADGLEVVEAPDTLDVVDSDGAVDGDAACLPTSATLDYCNGADDDCDGQTDEDPCDDGSACTSADVCVAGMCAGKPANCNDQDPCTLDGCAQGGPSAGICTHAPADGIPCDDGDPCSIGDNCKAGGCAGVAKNCVNSNFCFKAFCSPTDGKCTSSKKSLGTPCDDGNACTTADACDSDAVCSGGGVNCDDGNPCTLNACNLATGCTATESGAPCDDGNLCTQGDLCKSGKCDPGQAIVCNDNNPCTTESCDAGKCKITKNTQPCDDGTACTSGDACADGQCAGTPVNCDDKLPCTNDACDAQTGCLHNPASILCDDGNTCTKLDQCKEGACAGIDQTATLCDDGLPCTKDTCDGKAGCAHANQEGACDDGNPCTEGDQCASGSCAPGAAAKDCNCKANADCAAKEDGNLCNGTLYCDFSASQPTCKVNPATVVVCNDSADGDCAKNTCNAKSGSCAMVAVADGKACNADDSACTSGDVCKAGKCAAGASLDCNDKNPCTDDACDPAIGCVGLANQATCDADGSPCTVADNCANKVCGPGATMVCDDANPCTVDACDPKVGGCVSAAQLGACSDGDPCTLFDSCKAGACAGGSAKVCDDGNPCTADLCDKQSGACTQSPKAGPCSDNSACTLGDECGNGACVAGKPATCDDGNTCTIDGCDAASGKCTTAAADGPCNDGDACTAGDSCLATGCKPGVATVCNDNNSCTTDSCNPADGLCVYAPTSAICDDGNACTAGEACSGGVCKGGQWTCACTVANEAQKCNDNNACTDDKCVATSTKLECKNLAKSGGTCSDNNPCTLNDTCSAGQCQGNGAVDCDDKEPCTIDACNPANGACTHAPGGDVCNDNNPCTTIDKCQNGACVGSAPKACDDGKLCTTDSCNTTTGACLAAANTVPCDDGSACTTGDTCKDGACAAGVAKVCSDGNVCTDDSCGSVTGQCTFAANAAPCDDGDKCTSADACAAKACKGNPVACNDNNPCTNDACDSATGTCKAIANTVNCDDGNKCTVGDICAAGACKAGSAKSCADGTVCTDDSCDSATGNCVNAANTKPCDDGSKCTADDVCAAGQCKPGKLLICDDGNACTDDLCDPATGACGFTPNAKTCDDKNACTSGDACQGGTCVPGKFTCQCAKDSDCDDKLPCTQDNCNVTATGELTCSNAALNSGSCDDGNVCTIGDTCSAGSCKPKTTKSCDDANVCTADSCDPAKGCTSSSVSGSCTDGNPCTLGDLCANGVCAAGQPRDCNDQNPCTNDACDKTTGNCTKTNNSANCNDSNQCTLNDFCAGGACTPGTSKQCTDNKPCTDDACLKASGACEYTVDNTNTCSDGNSCTLTDVCDSGTCVGKNAKSCDDNNVCTTDGPCSPSTGICLSTQNTSTCNDNNACTHKGADRRECA